LHWRQLVTRKGAIAGAPLCALALATTTPSADAFEPIEGVWQTTTSIYGKFLVQQSGPSRFRFFTIEGDRHGSPCRADENGFVRPVIGNGTEEFLFGSGLTYTGRSSLWRVDPLLGTCDYLGDTAAQADVLNTDPDDYRVRYCARGRLDGAPLFDPSGRPAAGTNCTVYVRVRQPLPPVERAAQVVRLPRLTTTGSACRRRSRAAALRIANPSNEPLLSLTARVGAKTVKRLDYPITVTRLRLRLPRRRFTLSVAFETATRKHLTAARRYRACRA